MGIYIPWSATLYLYNHWKRLNFHKGITEYDILTQSISKQIINYLNVVYLSFLNEFLNFWQAKRIDEVQNLHYFCASDLDHLCAPINQFMQLSRFAEPIISTLLGTPSLLVYFLLYGFLHSHSHTIILLLQFPGPFLYFYFNHGLYPSLYFILL